MATKNQSPFIRGIENRLSAIFDEDMKQHDRTKVPDVPLKENDSLKEVSVEADVPRLHQDDSKKNIETSEPIKIAKSPFLQGIENRLDSIFDTLEKQPDRAEVPDIHVPQDDPLQEVLIDPDISQIQDDGKKGFKIDEVLKIEPFQSHSENGIEDRLDDALEPEISGVHQSEEIDPLKEITIKTNISGMHQEDVIKNADTDESIGVTIESSVGHEKENHLHVLVDSTIPDHTEEAVIQNLSEDKNLEEIEAKTTVSDGKDEKAERFEKPFDELITSAPIWDSLLKDLKSTVLSIEWEMTDQIMAKFDQEVNKLSSLFAEDKIILSFLRILRFLGRYIQVKGLEAHYGSVKLLLSIYDDLERVLLTRDMEETKKREILLEDINKYREWVETVDLGVRETDTLDREDKLSEDIKSKTQERDGKFVITEPNEAFACALDEIKKLICAEFSALRAEIKLWRQGQ